MAIVFVGIGVYSFMRIEEDIRLLGMVNYWDSLIQKEVSFFSYFKFLPLLLGALLAIMQYVPELQSKRLKLTLHLPLSDWKIIATMLVYGLTVVLLFVIISLTLLLLGLRINFPPEVVTAVFKDILPWFLAGLAAYLLASWVCIEPVWRQRVLNFLPTVGTLSFFFISGKPGAYQPMFVYLIVFVAIAFSFSFYSAIRFKEGK
jgi:hypothetical protein